jgi:NMD protein affecting ribosome stability and mRNA decay
LIRFHDFRGTYPERAPGGEAPSRGNVIYFSSKKIRRIVTTTNLWFANTEERKKKERKTAVFPLFLRDLCGLCGEFSSHYYDGMIFYNVVRVTPAY